MQTKTQPPATPSVAAPRGEGYAACSAFAVLFTELRHLPRQGFFVATWNGLVAFWISRSDPPKRLLALAERLGDGSKAGTRKRTPPDRRVTDAAHRVTETVASLPPSVAAAFEIHVLSALAAAWGGDALAAVLIEQSADMSCVRPVHVPPPRTNVPGARDVVHAAALPRSMSCPSPWSAATVLEAALAVTVADTDDGVVTSTSAVLTDEEGRHSWIDHVVVREADELFVVGALPSGVAVVLDLLREGSTLSVVRHGPPEEADALVAMVKVGRPDLHVVESDPDDEGSGGLVAACEAAIARRFGGPTPVGPQNAVIG